MRNQRLIIIIVFSAVILTFFLNAKKKRELLFLKQSDNVEKVTSKVKSVDEFKQGLIKAGRNPHDLISANKNSNANSINQIQASSTPLPTSADKNQSPTELNNLTMYERSIADSNLAKEEALKRSGLKINLPDSYIFDAGDPPLEGTLALHGRSFDGSSGLTMIAGKMNPSKDEILSFLKESPESFPNFDNKQVQWGQQSQNIPFDPSSGMRDGTLWRGTDAKGNVIIAVLLKRNDGQGSYLLVQNGSKDYIDENDGYWDKFKDSIKAVPIGSN